ncbi:MAG: carboxymuconolactone decarboxylase family protein [Erythrobacter sp.]|uniref:carboxymuconolactone decarboxylase family protein n=1 Tax=Erythrobacter sp. TaxID=1042 RepID=UPI0032ED6BC8
MSPGPGLPPLGDGDIPEKLARVIEAWPYKLHRTLAHSPDTLLTWLPFGEHILMHNTLPFREREIAILRVGWNARCAYEWGMHSIVARRGGFGESDFEALCVGAESPHWTPGEAAIVAAVDDMQSRWTIGEEVWGELAQHYAPDQIVDLVWLSGNFMTISLQLNALRVPLEDGLPPLPEDRPHYTRAT